MDKPQKARNWRYSSESKEWRLFSELESEPSELELDSSELEPSELELSELDELSSGLLGILGVLGGAGGLPSMLVFLNNAPLAAETRAEQTSRPSLSSLLKLSSSFSSHSGSSSALRRSL
jgi:hypothetical protein